MSTSSGKPSGQSRRALAALWVLVVRIQNVTANSFEFFVQNVNTNAAMAGYDVHFFVVEAGVYTVAADGVKMEAVRYNSTRTDRRNSWVAENRGYLNAYANPVVVGQVVTYNDPDWSVFWSRGTSRTQPASAAALWTGKHVAEDSDITRADETMGCVVFEEGAGNLNGLPFYAGDTQRTVASMGAGAPYSYAIPSGDAGVYGVASQTGERSGSGAFVHLHDSDPVDPGRISLSLDEDQLGDNERNHVTEHVHFLTFAGPCVARVQQEIEINWYFASIFGYVLSNPTVQGSATAYFDCTDYCSKLICLNELICP